MQPADKVIQATCPNCQKQLRVPESLLGQTIRCKACAHTFEIHSRPRSAAPATNDPNRPSPPLPAGPRAPMRAPAFAPLAETPTSLQRPTVPASRPAKVASSLPSTDPASGFTSAYGAAKKHKGGAYKPGRGRATTRLVLGFGFLVFLGIAGAAVYLSQSDKPTDPEVAENVGEGNSGTSVVPGTPGAAAPKGPYPRRMLAISVNNYIFANPVSYGDSKPELERDRRDVHAVVRKVATQWKIPTDQVYELTDGAAPDITPDMEMEPVKKAPAVPKTPLPKVKGKAPPTVLTEKPKNEPKFQPNKTVRQAKATDRPPFRDVIEKTIDLFLDGCRDQDRIIVLFTGHAMEKDGQAYLIPLEGDMEEVKTLIPLKPIYEKLGQCRAQQKIVVFDICRTDPGRGAERPTVGAMSEALEKVLHTPPEGVAVWTSCSKDEQAFEEDYGSIGGSEFWGSLFLSQYFHAASKGMFARNGKLGGLSAPEDPFPIETFSEWVDQTTARLSKENYKNQQTPKFTPAKAGKTVAWNPAEKPPARFEIPAPPQGVPREQVASIFKEINLPSLKINRADVPASSADATFPFPAEAMADYLKDTVDLDGMKTNPKKYAMRLAVLDATATIRRLRVQAEANLPETIGKSQAATDAFKKFILDNQTVPAEQQADLREALTMMEAALKAQEKEKEADREKSKRWLANFDYVYAQIKIRIAYLEEYNLAMGKIRKDELPALEGDKQNGWQLSSQEKMNCTQEYKLLAAEGKEKLEGIIKAHPNTPWAMLAKREKNTRLGLSWQPRTSE